MGGFDDRAGHPGAPDIRQGLHLFADGCFEPGSGRGGWAFVAYRDGAEISCAAGSVANTANNAMEVMALLQAVLWINAHAAGEAVAVWSDSVHAVKGCNHWRPIWRNNRWRKKPANGKARSRPIADPELWQALDRQLHQNPLIRVAWCKGHSGIPGNERADALADAGRRAKKLEQSR